jgi:glutamine amidotransferase
MIAIIDYDMGNSGSVLNMLKRLRADAVLTSDLGVAGKADKIIVPGDGAFDEGMSNLGARGMVDFLRAVVAEGKKPVLGICIGMQLLFEGSDEGRAAGLGFIPGRCIKIEPVVPAKVPHMGWDELEPTSHWLFNNVERPARFYFVHSFHCVSTQPADTIATVNYGGISISAAAQRGNVIGVQFHPEKSHKYGMQLLSNFVTAA